MQKNILVTGGAGFLGSHLCTKLIKKGHNVICVDNLHTGKKSKIKHLLHNPSFKFLQHDITSPFYYAVDEIYNLACPASPIHYQNNPIQTIKTSVIGAINLLELAKKTQAKILQASSSEVYGNPEVHPQTEDYHGSVNTLGIRGCYDEGKRCAETLFFDYHRQYNINIKIIRIFNTYGPNMNLDDGRAIPNFIVQALKNKNITIFGSGMQTRSFCYIDDLIEGMTRMMNSQDSFTGPTNIGNPNEITIIELAQKIIELTGSKSKISFQHLPQDDPIQRQPDITMAKENLNWKPSTSLESGLAKTIEYFEKLLK